MPVKMISLTLLRLFFLSASSRSHHPSVSCHLLFSVLVQIPMARVAANLPTTRLTKKSRFPFFVFLSISRRFPAPPPLFSLLSSSYLVVFLIGAGEVVECCFLLRCKLGVSWVFALFFSLRGDENDG